MIAVIADDLTGAAEIGGIGLQYNLKVEISQQVNPDTNADLLVINTDSRSKNLTEAIDAVTEACKQIKRLKPDLIYKKIDSVMRGHVLAEIEVELSILGWHRALIAPANPHLGRTLVDDLYSVDGIPVHQTSFAIDPEFPVLSSGAAGMLKDDRGVVKVFKPNNCLPTSGILVGEVRHADDLSLWAKHCSEEILPVGSGGFFSALLNSRFKKTSGTKSSKNGQLGKPVLYVSGTTFGDSAKRIKKLKTNGGPIAYMPRNLLRNPHDVNKMTDWCNEIVKLLEEHGKAVMAIEQIAMTGFKPNAAILRHTMAEAVRNVSEVLDVKELVIEGGSTAAAILNRLHINTLYPVHEFGPGIIRCSTMNAAHLHVTLKPGSYPWSEKTWIF